MRRQILRVASALAPLAALGPLAGPATARPASAPAATAFSTCAAGHYRLVDPSGDPQVLNLQISMAHRAPYSGRPSGAPKCLVAEAVAGLVQLHAAPGPPPHSVLARGARWSVGRFTCTYRSLGARPVHPLRRTSCVHTGRFPATVRFTLRGTA